MLPYAFPQSKCLKPTIITWLPSIKDSCSVQSQPNEDDHLGAIWLPDANQDELYSCGACIEER